jgi:hypothetical protein
MLELSIHQHLVGARQRPTNRGFDPGNGVDPATQHPSSSRLSYSHRARGPQDVANAGPNYGATSHVTPADSDRIADPAAAMDRAPQPQRRPNAQPQRPGSSSMPWV